MVHDGGGEHLEGGGGAQTAAPQDPGCGVGVKAPHLVAQLVEPGGYAPDQAHGGAGLRLVDVQVLQVHDGHAVVPGLDADSAGVVGHHAGDGVQVHGGGEAVAPLVVGVTAAQLRPARGGEEPGVRLLAAGEGGLEFPHQLPQAVRRAAGAGAVDLGQPVGERAAVQCFQKFSPSHVRALHAVIFTQGS